MKLNLVNLYLQKIIFMSVFERVTGGGRVIKYIDGLRGLSVFIVLFCHFIAYHEVHFPGFDKKYQWLYPFFGNGFGHHAVYLFFAISGFILALPFINQYIYDGKKVDLKGFYTRRISRIEPPYIILLTLFFVFALVFGAKTFEFLFPRFLASFFYLHNIIFGGRPEINIVLWTLEIEVQFYLLAPLFSLLIFKLPKWPRRVLMLAIVACWQYLESPFGVQTLFNYFHYFMTGFLAADLYLEYKDKIKPSFWFDAICLPALFIYWQGTLWMEFHWLYILIFLFLTPFSKIWKFMMERRFMILVGGMCYSFYMLHHKLIYVVFGVFKPNYVFFGNDLANFFFRLVFISLVIAFFTIVFFVFVERPTMKREWWKYRSLKKLFFE